VGAVLLQVNGCHHLRGHGLVVGLGEPATEEPQIGAVVGDGLLRLVGSPQVGGEVLQMVQVCPSGWVSSGLCDRNFSPYGPKKWPLCGVFGLFWPQNVSWATIFYTRSAGPVKWQEARDTIQREDGLNVGVPVEPVVLPVLTEAERMEWEYEMLGPLAV